MSQHEHNEAAEPSALVVTAKSFAPSEMITCESCARSNPPTRAQCLYCGSNLTAALHADDSEAVREAGDAAPRCIFFLSADQLKTVGPDVLTNLARTLDFKLEDINTAIEAGGPLPIASLSNAAMEEKLIADMRRLSLEVCKVPEGEVGLHKIRSLDVSSDSLRALPADATHDWSDIVLIISGRVVITRIEIDEKHRRGKSKPLDARQFSSDQSVMDIYFRSGDAWRIYEDNFDYSCLGERKAITGFENFGRLLEFMRERANDVEVDHSYARKRALLSKVWPLDEENRKSVSFVRDRKHQQSTTTSNESQFGRYSRAVYLLKMGSEECAE